MARRKISWFQPIKQFLTNRPLSNNRRITLKLTTASPMSQDVQVPWCKCQWIPCRATQSRSVSKKMPWQRQSSWIWPLGWSGRLYPWGSCYCFQSIKRTKESVSLFNQNSWKFSHCPLCIRGIWKQGSQVTIPEEFELCNSHRSFCICC